MTNLIYTVYACHVCKHLFMYEYIKNGCILYFSAKYLCIYTCVCMYFITYLQFIL